MKKQILVLSIGFLTFCSTSALAYLGPNEIAKKGTKTPINKAAGCLPATAKLTMEFNDVRALIENGGGMFQDRAAGVAAYEIPKAGPNEVKHFAIYSGSLWMGGTDVNGQLKLAALRFRSGNDFWPGPLSVTAGSGNYDPLVVQADNTIKDYGAATVTPETCIAYDKFFTMRKAEVINFSSWFECNNQGLTGVPVIDAASCASVEDPSNEVLNRIENWPAHGDVSLGQDYYLAPFYDRDQDGNYNPLTSGDYPWYDDILGRDDIECGVDRRISLFGDETHWWVFNDKGNIHTETSGEPIGMEIRAQAFAFATNDDVNRMTFYNYELINRGTQTLYDTYFSQFIDADIGNYQDDYAGCDVSRGLGYMFNGDNNDETNGQNAGYGINPPSIGVDFFEGPYKDPDGIDNGYYPSDLQAALSDSGIVYKGIGIGFGDSIVDNERFGMTRFTYFTSTATYPYSDPQNAAEYYNFMKGKWANGSNMVYGGQGYASSTGATTTLSTYMFPGDSDPLGWATDGAITNSTWDESTSNNPAGDRRFVQSAGAFTLKPGAVNNITVGIVYGRGYDGDLFSSVRALKRADTKAQALFDACFKIFDPPMAPKLTIQELDQELVLMLDNPSASHNNYREGYEVEDEINITIDTLADGSDVDKFYRFEGYQIYQLKNSAASVADINDPTKAQLVAQCDLKNGISRLINFEYDEALGFAVPVEKVNGADSGIKHTFKITEDMFALGTKTLVNFKQYYYVAVAYAYNNYQTYNPNDPLLLGGQQTPYVSSRLGYDGNAIASVSAIPHNPIAEAGGTDQLVEYGSSPRITRLDGYGNGGRAISLTQETEDEILANGFVTNPTYDYNAGPINIKVVDPLNIASGYFECLFDDNGYTTTGHATDSAKWVINRYDYENGTKLESDSGTVNIAIDNEQVIPRWGISVQINQIKYTGTSATSLFTNPITSSITFSDSSKRWLGFIADQDGTYPNNWIRSGSTADTLETAVPAYTAPACYKDELELDDDKLYTSLVGGGIAPQRLVGYQCNFQPLAYYNVNNLNTAGSYRDGAHIAYSPSIDIVITSDETKWTRCPVIELGRDAGLTLGGAKAGGMRKSPSVGKDGLADGTGTGMGWFPGYAIDVETGARLYMAFGENSFLTQENGADMIWNPTDNYLDAGGNIVLGGQHPIYVFNYKAKTINNYGNGYDLGAYDETTNEVAALLSDVETSGSGSAMRKFYGNLAWIANIILNRDMTLLSSDVRISVRVEKEYKKFTTTGKNNGYPMFSWNMDDIRTKTNVDTKLAEVLDIINVVPNPYYAYSEYEGSRLQNFVKITNLPEVCTVKIYTVNGKLVRTFKKDSPQTYIDWDLKNHQAIPIAGGIYLIHVEVPGIGERVVKFFGGMRQIDLHGI